MGRSLDPLTGQGPELGGLAWLTVSRGRWPQSWLGTRIFSQAQTGIWRSAPSALRWETEMAPGECLPLGAEQSAERLL